MINEHANVFREGFECLIRYAHVDDRLRSPETMGLEVEGLAEAPPGRSRAPDTAQRLGKI